LNVNVFTFRCLKLIISSEILIRSYIDIDSNNITGKIKVYKLQTLKLRNLQQNIPDFLKDSKNIVFKDLRRLEIQNCPEIRSIEEYFLPLMEHFSQSNMLEIKCDKDMPLYKELLYSKYHLTKFYIKE